MKKQVISFILILVAVFYAYVSMANNTPKWVHQTTKVIVETDSTMTYQSVFTKTIQPKRNGHDYGCMELKIVVVFRLHRDYFPINGLPPAKFDWTQVPIKLYKNNKTVRPEVQNVSHIDGVDVFESKPGSAIRMMRVDDLKNLLKIK